VHQHRGWITTESAVGQGTTIRVYLPISCKPELGALASAEAVVKGGDETILLVEDDEVVRRLCAAMLLRFGYRVLLSADGHKALRIWEQNPGAIDLLLSDMVLPGGISGLELAEQLSLKKPALGVVLMSGYNTEIMKADGVLDKGFKFVQKPVESAALASVIRSCLD
jgi:two-component system, cell cycle sensor histidine kinase and response regulator CckA